MPHVHIGLSNLYRSLFLRFTCLDLIEDVIDKTSYLGQAVWYGYVLPRLADNLGSNRFRQMGAEGD